MIADKETRDIQAYFRNTLPPERRKKFEEKMQNDPEFKRKVDELRPIFETLWDLQLKERTKEIIKNNIEAEGAPPLKKKPMQPGKETEPTIRLWQRTGIQWLAAASVVLLLGVFLYDTTLDDRIAKQYNFPLTGPSAGADSGDVCPEEADLRLLYQNTEGAYKELLEKLGKKSQSPCVRFYEGMCFLGLEEAEKALPFLLNGKKSENREIRQNAEWYLSLAYLKIHDRGRSTAQLRQITESGEQHRFKQPARELLLELMHEPIFFNFQF